MTAFFKILLTLSILLLIQLLAWQKLKNKNYVFSKYLPKPWMLAGFTLVKLSIKIAIGWYAFNAIE